MTQLSNPWGDYASEATAVNDRGQVVGTAGGHAVLWQNGTVKDLGILPGGGGSGASSINTSGQIVGTAWLPGPNNTAIYRAVLYDSVCGGAIDLNDQIPAGSGWTLTDAVAINDTGLIIGNGVINGQTHGFVLTPQAPPMCGLALASQPAAGGQATATPAGPAYPRGASVTLAASANPGYQFVGWTVDGTPAGAANPLTLTMDRNHAVVATFVPIPPPTYTLSITTVGPGSTIPAGVRAHAPGTVVPLAAPSGYLALFLGWTIDGAFRGWANPLTLTMDADHTVVATFAPRQSFPDVTSATTGAVEPIAQLAARGVIKGYQDGRFGPADPTLRAQMAALIVRAMGWGAEDPPNPFADRNGVDDELWRDVAILAAHGVAKGYGDGTYGTTGPVLNAQVISFIARAMVDKGYWQFQPDDAGVYPNVAASSGHRVDLVTYVHFAGPVRGAADARAPFLGWDQPSSRAYFAFALWQALDSYFAVDRVP